MKKHYSKQSVKSALTNRKPVSKKQARKPLISALEPRLLLDGAAVVTAVDVFTDSQLHNDASQTDSATQDADASLVVAPTEVRAVDPAQNNGKKEVVFIEDNLADYQTLIDGINAGVEIVLLDSTQDGLAQMAQWAGNNSDYDAIHIISHGAEAQVNLGGFSLDNITVNTRSADLAQLGAALNEEGDLLLYGCEVASGEGQDFISALAQATQADVAASDDITGATVLGGDWVLEKQTGVIAAADLGIGLADNYGHTLETITFVEDSSEDGSANINNSFTRTISGAEFTFAAGSTLTNTSASYLDIQTDGASVYEVVNGGIGPGVYALTDRNNYSGLDFSIKVEEGYTFDLTGFEAQLRTGELSIYYIKYGVSGTQQKDFSLGGTDAFQAYSGLTDFDDITEIVFTSENYGLFQDLIITDVKAIPVNNAPTVTGAPADITVTEDTASNVNLSGVTFADSDGDNLTVTLTASAGTLAASSSGNVTVSGSGTGALTLSGSSADINSYLDTTSNVQYTGASNASGDNAATLSIKANDGTTDSSISTVNIDITAVNDAPSAVSPTTGSISTLDSANATVATVSATDVDDSSWKYSIQSITLNSVTQTNDGSLFNFATDANTLVATNMLRATTPSGLSAGTYTITVVATDAGGLDKTEDINIMVTDDALVTTTGANTGSDSSIDGSYAADLADGGGLSLAEALHYASTNSTVEFNLSSGATVDLNNATLIIASGVTFDTDSMTNLSISNGTLTLSGGLSIINGAGDTTTIASTLAGDGSLAKTGDGKLTLSSSSNSYSGTTEVTGGTLSISSDANLGGDDVILRGGANFITVNNVLTVDNNFAIETGGATFNQTGSGHLTLSGQIAGDGKLIKAGGGSMTLSANYDSFEGGVQINNGTLNAKASTDGLGYGAVTLVGGTLAFSDAGTVGNNITVSADATISNSTDVTLNGIISGDGALTKAGAGTMKLSAEENTHTGNVTVTAGTLAVSGGSSIGDDSAVTVNSGASLSLLLGNETIGSLAGVGSVSLGYSLTVGNASSTTFSGVISSIGTYGINKVGAGTLTLSGANTYTGSTNVSAGTLVASGGSAIADSSALTVASGATFELDSFSYEAVGSIAGAGSIVGNGGTLIVGGNNASTTFSGVISEGSEALALTKLGSGTLTLSASNTYSGSTAVLAGGLSISSDSNLGSGALTLNSGTLSVTGNGANIDNAISLLSNGGVVSVDTGVAATLSGAISGAGSLTKSSAGEGSLILSGTNTYTGSTTINGGTLTVTDTLNGSGAGAVTVNAGTLEGTGTINSAVTVNATGTLSAGTAANTGTLTINGDVLLNGALSATINSASDYDKIAVTGTVDLLNNSTLSLSGDYVVPAGATAEAFELISNDNSDAISSTFSNLSSGTSTFNNVELSAAYDGGTGNDFLLTGPKLASISAVSAATANGSYKAGDTISIAVSFDEAVTVSGTPQLTLETGAVDRVVNYVSGSGTDTLTFSYTVQAGDSSLDLDYANTTALSLNGGTIKNAADNDALLTLATPGAAHSLGANKDIVIDTTAPDATSAPDLSVASDSGVSSTDNITNKTTPTITGTSEANATVKLYDTNGTTELGSTTADGSGNWSITSSTLTAGSHTLTAKATDAAGNVGSASAGLTVSIDTTAPTLSSSAPSDNAVQVATNGDITLTFDEDIVKGYDTITLVNASTGATVETFNVLNGSNLTLSDNTLTLDPTSDLDEATTYAIQISSTAVRDVAGNAYVGISDNTTLNFTTGVTDTVAPTFLSIQRADDNVITGSTTTFTLTFNEAVNATAADFALALTGSAAGTIGSISGSGTNTITVNVTGVSGVGSLGLNLASSHGVKDLAGNTLATAEPSDDEVYLVDTVAPTLISINRVDNAATNADSVQFIAVFSENVTGLSADDFELTGAAANGASISSVTGTDNGFVITVAGVIGDGNLGVQLKSVATVNDAAGNALTATTASAVTEQYTIDNTAPSATAIITTNTALSTADTVTFDVTFSEAVANISIEDFELSGDVTGTISAVSGSGSSYTVTVGSITGDGALGLNFKAGQNITDTAGNSFAGSEPSTDESYTIDNTLPTVTSISRGMVNQVAADTATDVVFTVVFSETVSGVAVGDFAVTGNATNTGITSVSSADGKVFKVTVGGVNGTIGQTVGLSFTGSADDALSQASTAEFTSGDSYTIAGTLLNEGALTQEQLDAIVDLNREGTLFEQSVDGATEVVIVDSRVSGLVDLTKASNPNADIWLLDGSRSATEQIGEILANYSGLDALHILSHGGVGEIYLGAETISAEELNQNTASFAAWGNAFSETGDILLYGCNVAQGDTGQDFINQLAQITSADIAASDDLTGSAVLGGDWELESAFNVEASTIQIESYEEVLATGTIKPTGTAGQWYDLGAELTDGEQNSVNITGQNFEIFYANSALSDIKADNIGLYQNEDSDFEPEIYNGERATVTNAQLATAFGGDGTPRSYLVVKSTDGSEFKFSGVNIFNNYGLTGDDAKLTIIGYRNGVTTGSITIQPNDDPTYISQLTSTELSASIFENVDRVEITPSSLSQYSSGPNAELWHYFNAFSVEDPALANQAPAIADVQSDQAVNDTATLSPFSNIALADADGDDVSITVALDTAAKGVFTAASLTASGFTDAGSGSYTLASTTLVSAQTALRALVFDPADNRVAVDSTETTTFTITVNDGTTDTINSTTTVVSTSINDAPSDIALSDSNYVHSEGSSNIVVGSFSATDADTSGSFTYSLVSGTGDTDNGKFNISGTDLRATSRADVPAGTYNIRVQVNDGDATFEKAFTITVTDDVAPIISAVVPADNASGVSVADSIQVTFDEGAQLGSAGTITLYDITGSGANSVTIDVSSHADQLSIVDNVLTINPSDNLMATNQYAIQMTAGALKDDANNDVAAVSDTTSYNFTTGTVDTTAPTVAIVDVTSPNQPNAGTVSINFSEQVTNVDISDFSLTKDSETVDISGLSVVGSGSAYSIDLSSITAAGGVYVLTLNTSNIADTSGNALAAGDSESFIIDATAPTGVAIVRAGAETQSGSAVTFTAVFSEAVSGVDAADFTLTGTAAGGSITSVTQVSDSVYTITVNGVSSDGTLGVNLNAAGTGISDTAGNAISAGVTGQQVTIDNTGPSVLAINRDAAALTTADSATFTVTFDEAVSGLDISDFSLLGGASGTVTSISGSGTTYQVTVNNISGDGSLRLDLNAPGTGITDAASNAIGAGFTSGDTLTIDNTAAVVTADQSFNLDEGMATDTVIGQVKASDANGVSQFVIQSGNDNGYFAIDSNGVLTLTSAGAAAIDYETLQTYTLNIVATDALGQASSSVAITIAIQDVNDNAPVFSSANTASVAENSATTQVVYDAYATDADTSVAYNSVTYSLKATDDHSAFTINSSTGEVKLIASADYETKSSYSFTVIASDGMRSTEQAVTLNVSDVNDNTPVIISGTTGNVDENAATSTVIYTATGTDADGTAANSTLVYSLSGDDADKLNINATTGAVTLKASADYEAKASYSFNVIATDNGAGNFNSGSLSTTQAVTVSVNDLNETPVANSDMGSATEAGGVDNGTAGSNASGNVLSNDTDVDGTDTKTVSDVSFGSNSGVLGQALSGRYGALTLNADGSYHYVVDNTNAAVQGLPLGASITDNFTYTLTDKGALTDTATLVITVHGANDNPTQASDDATEISETVDATAQDISTTGEVSFADVDASDVIDVTFASNNNITWSAGTIDTTLANKLLAGFSVTGTSIAAPGAVDWSYDVTDANLDFLGVDETITFSYTVTVTDSQNATATDTVSFTITGSNDAPVISVVDVAATITEGSTLIDTGSVTFTDLDLTDRPVATEATQSVTAKAQDGSTVLMLTTAQQTAIEKAFSIENVSSNTNDGTVNWTYDIAETDLDFLGEGEVVTAIFTITVTDDEGATATQDVTVTLTGSNDAPVISVVDVAATITEGSTLIDTGSVTFTDVDLTDRPVATEATQSVTAKAQDGSTVLTLTTAQQTAIESAFSIENVSSNTNDGTVNWTYDIAETDLDFLGEGEVVTAIFTITVTDNEGATATQDVTVTLTGSNDVPTATGTVANMSGTSGQIFTPVTLPANLFTDVDAGETAKLVWSIENLPTGLVFNAATRTISGTPQGGFEGVNVLQVVATDGSGGQVKVPVTLTLESAPVSPPSSAPVDVPPSVLSQSTGFSAPELTVTTGSLPSGTLVTSEGSSGFFDIGTESENNGAEQSNANTVIISESRVTVNVGANGQVQVTDAGGVPTNTTGLTVANIVSQVDRVSITIADASTVAQYSATLADGTALPDWVEVNSSTGEVTMNPPAGQGVISLKINSVDADGNVRVLEIEVDLANLPSSLQAAPANTVSDNGAAFMSLDEQLTAAAEQYDDYGSGLMKLLAS
ncbi:DUF4347 domain-containing protein [Marinomonas sp. M1K-6]|uniref:DUF4347 domain-containing protein n=1 Tax=Marinomonas profundi TaxID=2726122 RepID=A0A847R290_9GAMM|nr:DUF4347 domain-containing protein [Marinomonas profundi]NLQ17935.1 DUF4347 domain-containing protein [Marinomonas profundi]UDV03411.1 DUF4347 domain-containing protein [Marinomonas profundi]